MKITNKFNLPESLVKVVENDQKGHEENCYGVTTILNPIRSILLKRRYEKEIETDVSESINKIFGTAIHSLIEKFDKTGMAEIELKEEISNGFYLVGKCDLYDELNKELVDWKTANVWKIKFNDFEDWKKQGLMYAWLLVKKGYAVKKIKFHALLKDWTARELRIAKLKGDFYPESQVYTYEYEVSFADLVEIELFIRNKFAELIACKELADDNLPDCGKEDTWYTGDKFAVYKNATDVKATRVFDTEQEAKDYLANKMAGKGLVVFRKGEYRKCQDYCECQDYCKYYEERKAE